MRLNTTCLILVGFITTITSCSHPQVRDASQLDADDTKALLGAICDETQAASGCSACPTYLEADHAGPLRIERVLHGSFSYGTADETLVEISGCGGHDVIALERRDGKWHRFGWQQNVSLGECEQVELDSGATGLVCHTPPEAHRKNRGLLGILAVENGKLKRNSITRHPGPRSCDQPNAGGYRRIDDWSVSTDGNTTVQYSLSTVCIRTRPGQTLCEAKDEGIEPLVQKRTDEHRVDWSALIPFEFPNFCDRANIEEVMTAAAPKLEECVALGDEKARTGSYVVQWKVKLDGGVYGDSPHLRRAPNDNSDVEACFKQVLSKLQFDKPDGGICIVNYPFFFKDGTYWKNACGHFDPPPLEWLEAQSTQ